MPIEIKTVLVVDDEDSVRYVISSQLEELGYKCATASGGQDALDRCAGEHFDLVMLDVKMPGMTGLQVLSRLRADEARNNLCIVMMTAVVDADIAAHAMDLGADAYITKPSSLKQVGERLVQAHEHRRKVVMDRTGSANKPRSRQEAEDLSSITKDLIQQQVAAFEEGTSSTGQGDKERKRRFWPWRK